MVAAGPIIDLYAYQRPFFDDQARVQALKWCRQAGKDFTTSCKVVDESIRTHSHWYIVSLTQRQADATFAKCKQVAEVFKAMLKLVGEITATDGEPYVDYDDEIDESFRCTARTLHLPGGGTVTSLPGRNPDTLAGLTGNVIFTEFALFPKGGAAHWRVIFPLVTRGYRVIAISTPRGKNTKFFELISHPELYSVHVVDIHQAVAGGMPLKSPDGSTCTIEQLEALYNDPIGWKREYLCEESGDLQALLAWNKLVAAAELGRDKPFDALRVEKDAGWQPGFFNRLAKIEGRLELGWDVARHGNLATLWCNQARRGQPKALRALVVMHDTSFALQRQIISEAMECKAVNVGQGDSTGLGMDSNETLESKYPGRWKGFTFTSAGKRKIGSNLLTAFSDGTQSIPAIDGEHKFIATDLYAVQRETAEEEASVAGVKALNITESENPLAPESHCDIAYSGGLSLEAAQMPWAVSPAIW